MLQKVDMPSYSSDHVDHSDISKPFSGGYNSRYQHSQQQYSTITTFEKPTPATEDIPGGWPNEITPSVNGLQSGPERSLPWPLTNGTSFDDTAASGRDRTPSGKESIVSLRSKRSGGPDGKRSLEVPNFSKGPMTDDDGYFTGVNTASRSNGVPRSPNAKSSLSGTNDLSSGPNSRSVSLAHLPAAAPSLPPVNEKTSQTPSDDRMLRVPHSAHRASSPPAFSQTSSPLAPTQSANPPNRLVHRHTLEVPKAPSRNSKDSQAPSGDEPTATATGRFSPNTNLNTPSRRRGSSQLARRPTRSINSDMYLDDFQQDEDAARWTEHIKQKRASKRKRDEEEDHVVVGTKVDQNHVNYETAYNMLTGIRFTVSRTNAKIDRDLTDADFDAKNKFSFDITGNELTPSAKYDFKFKDYAPWVFRHLRQTFHLDPADYLVSLTSKYILSELGSPGKSGSFFYFSRDYKYIIKTIHHAEHKFLRKILRQYHSHVHENPNTLLSQFYGLHRVKIPYGRKIHFVVMNNLFPPHRDIHRTFDLKGSTVGRDFKEEELEKNPRATLKDLNWLRRNLHLEFGPIKKQAFVEQMQRDVALLQKLKIMDYSMLVGIHDLERGNEENLRDKTLQVFSPGGEKADGSANPNMLMRTPSKLENARKARELRQLIKTERPVPMEQTIERMPDSILDPKKNLYFYSDDGGFRATHEDESLGDEIYYLGIIDCLTHYSFIKRAEHFWKGMSSPESQISAIPPERYGDRFIKFIAGITKTRERAEFEKDHPEIANDVGHAVRKAEGTLDDPQLAGVNLVSTTDLNGNPAGTDKVMRKAQQQAEKSKRHGATEDDVPDRSISAVRSPDVERQDLITLPVIGEAVESGSATSIAMTPQGSKESLRSLRGRNIEPHHAQQTVLGNADMSSQSLGEVPPPTPPKSDGPLPKPFSITEYARGRIPDRPPPTPPKDERDLHRLSQESQRSSTLTRSSLDKALPQLPVPQGSKTISTSPARGSVDEMESLRSRVAGLSHF